MISLKEIPYTRNGRQHSKFLDAANILLSDLSSPRRTHFRRPSSHDKARSSAFINVDHDHDLGLENLLSRELNTLSPDNNSIYMHKLNECFHTEDIYQ